MGRRHGGESTRATIAEQSNVVTLNNKSKRLTKEHFHLLIYEKNPMKLTTLFAILFLGIFVVGACVLWWRLSNRNLRPASWQSSGPTVESVRRIAELLTLRVSVADVLTGEGYGYRGAWIVKGDAFFGIDLEKIDVPVQLRNDAYRSATIVLPRPRLKYARLNHDVTKTWQVSRDAWWRSPSGEHENRLRDESMREGQRVIKFAVNKEEHSREAQSQSADVIQTIYRHVGWTVEIRWTDDAAADPVKSAMVTYGSGAALADGAPLRSRFVPDVSNDHDAWS
jgi:hypothetical protein